MRSTRKPGHTPEAPPIDPGRRKFFRRFLSEAACWFRESHGQPPMSLSDLEGLPDGTLRHIVPVMNGQRPYRVENGLLYVRPGETGEYVEQFRLETGQERMLSCFDGYRTLEQAACVLADRFGTDREETYQRAKALFLLLVKHDLCRPAPVPLEQEGEEYI